jgi:hypothetical protein
MSSSGIAASTGPGGASGTAACGYSQTPDANTGGAVQMLFGN